jgi:hypothetical protein
VNEDDYDGLVKLNQNLNEWNNWNFDC